MNIQSITGSKAKVQLNYESYSKKFWIFTQIFLCVSSLLRILQTSTSSIPRPAPHWLLSATSSFFQVAPALPFLSSSSNCQLSPQSEKGSMHDQRSDQAAFWVIPWQYSSSLFFMCISATCLAWLWLIYSLWLIKDRTLHSSQSLSSLGEELHYGLRG